MKDANAAMTCTIFHDFIIKLLLLDIYFHGIYILQPSITSTEQYKAAEPKHDRSHVVLIAQLVEHCTGNTKVEGSNPV